MLPLNKSQIPILLSQARAHEAAGRFNAAKSAYENVLQIDDASPQAHFQLGQLLAKARQYKVAITHLKRAAQLYPKERAIWEVYVRVVKAEGSSGAKGSFLAEAEAAEMTTDFRNSLKAVLFQEPTRNAQPELPKQELQQIMMKLSAGAPGEAVALANQLRIAHPNQPVVANIYAISLAANGQPKEAEQAFVAAIAIDPQSPETRSNLGHFLNGQGRHDEAIKVLNQALSLKPDFPDALFHMGVALRAKRAFAGAMSALEKGLKGNPKHADMCFELAQIYTEEYRFEESLPLIEQAGTLGVDARKVAIWKASALSGLGRDEEALALLSTYPEDLQALFSKATILQSQGQFDAARALYLKILEAAPSSGRVYFGYVSGKKVTADDPIIAQMEAQFQEPNLADADKINMGFALGKALEDTGDFDRVFSYLRPASALVRKAHGFDFDLYEAQTRDGLEALKDYDYQGTTIAGCSDYAPIFVTGLPRSGTTLVEQILTSHSSVAAGGELGFAHVAWADALNGPPRQAIHQMSEEQIISIGHKTEAQMVQRIGQGRHATDKSVLSYGFIGPIRLSLPNARVIVVKRDPRDNILSLYKNLFNDGLHLYSYDLQDLVRYYRLHEEILAFWEEQTPGWMHVVEYEKLIADPEGEARALVAAAGLAWEPACLNFYENKRRVDTLSVHQVRQPMYSSSIGSWKRYETDLAEMLTSLETGQTG